jgi:hypothetical protein
MEEMQEFNVDGKSAKGYITFPKSGNGVGVIVLHARDSCAKRPSWMRTQGQSP